MLCNLVAPHPNKNLTLVHPREKLNSVTNNGNASNETPNLGCHLSFNELPKLHTFDPKLTCPFLRPWFQNIAPSSELLSKAHSDTRGVVALHDMLLQRASVKCIPSCLNALTSPWQRPHAKKSSGSGNCTMLKRGCTWNYEMSRNLYERDNLC